MNERERTALDAFARELSAREQAKGEPGTSVPGLESIRADELQAADIPPLQWVVDEILPQGMTLLAAPPKYGKSWLCLDLCISVASGRPFLGFSTHQSEVLYLALEDGYRRLKDRMGRVLDGEKAPDKLYFAVAALALDKGLAQQVDEFVAAHPDTRLIVLDVLARVRSTATRQTDGYRLDYEDMARLQAIATRHNLALVVVHHARKMKDEADVFNSISGTNGLFGGADGAWVLQKDKRAEAVTCLHITGREVPSETYELSLDKASCRWKLLGTAGAALRTGAVRDPVLEMIRALARKRPEGWAGTSAQLLAEGQALVNSPGLTDPAAIGRRIPELQTVLAAEGIFWQRRTKDGRTLHSFSTNPPWGTGREVGDHDG